MARKPSGDEAGLVGTSELIDANRLAELLDVCKRTVHRLRSRGKMLQPFRVGAQWRWRLSEVTRWIEAGCPDPGDWKLKRGA
jgi:predicted DNA-binding transcriptional regulator AlpA